MQSVKLHFWRVGGEVPRQFQVSESRRLETEDRWRIICSTAQDSGDSSDGESVHSTHHGAGS